MNITDSINDWKGTFNTFSNGFRFKSMDYDNKGYITIKDLRKYFKVKSSYFYLTCFESTNLYSEFPLDLKNLKKLQ